MFESAELGHTIDKKTWDQEVPALREQLLDAEYDLVQAKKFPVIVLIGGVDGAGKGETVNLLNEWMDPRHIRTHAMGEPSDEELARPPMWRFWRALPPRGKIGIFFGSWYTKPIIDRVYKRSKKAHLDHALEEILHFERMLAAEGALVLKFWFHLSKERQRARLNELSSRKKTRWRVTERDWEHFALYDRFRKISERALRQTSTAEAPWTIVEGTCPRFRALTVGRAIRDAIRARLDAPAPEAAPATPLPSPALDRKNVIASLDLSRTVTEDDYDRRLEELQGTLNLLSRDERFHRKSVVLVFEGQDAAGKGGTIRRVTSALDARRYIIVPIAAPTEEERVQPYLWRFWRHMPRRGHVTIFDRSWYGRVLVERVEGFCPEAAWLRAYQEINDFEEQLVRHGTIVLKFWLQVGKEEQLRRFKEREETGFKRFKITEEDWRNRDKWDAYELAIGDMIDRTSTEIAPWTLVPANDKKFARLEVLSTICDRIGAEIG